MNEQMGHVWGENKYNGESIADCIFFLADFCVLSTCKKLFMPSIKKPPQKARKQRRTSRVEGFASMAKTSPLKLISCENRMLASPIFAPASTTVIGRSFGRKGPSEEM